MKTVHRSWLGALAAAFALVVLPGQALAGNATNINVTLPVAKASISGTITKHGGGAVNGALVQLVKPGETFPTAFTLADTSGNFSFFEIGTGDFTVAVNPQPNAPTYMPGFYLKTSSPDHVTSFQASATTLHYTGTKIGNVNMAVQVGHSISGRIRAANGLAPLKGVTVSAILDPSSGSTPFSTLTTTTNASGNYSVTGLPKGKFSLKADPNAGFFFVTRVNFLAGCFVNSPPHNYTANCASPTLISINNANVGSKNIDIPSGHRITGLLKDAQGHNLCASITVSGASFELFPPSTSSCGAFAVVGLASGDYTVTFTPAQSSHFVTGSYATNAHHFVQTGTAGATVHITSADKNLGTVQPDVGHTVSGQIKMGTQGVQNVSVTLSGSTGSVDTVNTNALGKFTFYGVGSGTHTIQVAHGTSGKNLRTGYFRSGAPGNFTTVAGQATALFDANHSGIVIKPPAGYVISGKIQNAAHQGIKTVVILQGPAFIILFSNAQGVYGAIGLDPGDYTLTASSAKNGATTYRGGYYTTANANHYTPNFGSATPIHVGP